jgi:hypothetical protein
VLVRKWQKIVEASSLWFSCDLETFPPRAYLDRLFGPATLFRGQPKRHVLKHYYFLPLSLGDNPEPLQKCSHIVITLPDKLLIGDSSKNQLVSARMIHDYYLFVRFKYSEKWSYMLKWENYLSVFSFHLDYVLLSAGVATGIASMVAVFLLQALPVSVSNTNNGISLSGKARFILLFGILSLYTVIAALGCFEYRD